MIYYAHTKKTTGQEAWQTLDEHLQNVSEKTATFASMFKAEDWGKIAGLIHDIGKTRLQFQKKLITQSSDRQDHKGVGARLLKELNTPFGQIIAYCVAGHHGGLPNGCGTDDGTSLERLVKKSDPLPSCISNPLNGFTPPTFPFEPLDTFQYSFFTRMLFSALVDADFLDTERFMDPEKAAQRDPGPSLESLAIALDTHLAGFGTPKNHINKLRTEILQHSRNNAELEPGLFTMTVPTGGGKTLSSMAFALNHALKHGLRRIIYVIPYTSIIEQNAQVFRDIFPAGSVVEHHSTFDVQRLNRKSDEYGDEPKEIKQHRLACENWDAPVVVTTNVQFFESLFASKTSRCRKLHNLAKSVIILDEAQMLPVPFLKPCIRALDELTRNYGASVVLCTATQPALDIKNFDSGLDGLREIAPDPVRMHQEFTRTRLVDAGELSLADVAKMIRDRDQVLCIVNTRSRAAELFEMVKGESGAFHLSALMYPSHRSEILSEIKLTLEKKQPCRVISTQLIEAGVDISFPEVIREISGLDAITQAAGRCNREGELPGLANVTIFRPQEGIVPAFRMAAGSTESTLRCKDDPFSPEAIRHYFGMTYWLRKDELDKNNIIKKLNNKSGLWDFRVAAREFRLIDSDMIPVIIPGNQKAQQLVDSLRYAEFGSSLLRQLQQYTVQVYKHQFAALNNTGAIEFVSDIYAVLMDMESYDPQFGLTFPEGAPDAGDFIF